MGDIVLERWHNWISRELIDKDLEVELQSIRGNNDEIKERFYRDLEFGTGGLRGIIGAGTNRLNVYTVAKATQGYCNYLNIKFEHPEVAVAYDSRIKSDLFAKVAAEVFAANGIKVYMYSELMPTPALSFAVRHFQCAGGIVITASHNPAKYNGYKVYGQDGCQITTDAAAAIFAEIEKIDIFSGITRTPFQNALDKQKISYIDNEVVDLYLDQVSSQALCDREIDRTFSIVYTPLNGAGLKCVTEVLKRNGFDNVSIVAEQEEPNGEFPTCPYPNPEMKEALALALRDAKRLGSDLLLATDPDCDRVGIAVRNADDYVLLSGNEVGILLFDYICQRRITLNRMPVNPVVIKTVVTIDMIKRMAEDYGVKVIDVLTGFKFIGEQIGLLEDKGEEDNFIFGFEESYGYLTGSYVRDKDAVNGSLMICEMFAYYRVKGTSLIEVLEGLYLRYGYSLNTLHSYAFEGAQGFQKMQHLMKHFREGSHKKFAGKRIIEVKDYLMGIDNLPHSDVLKYLLEGDCSIVIRPSGTEPKLKVYFSISAKNRVEAENLELSVLTELEQLIK